MESSRNACMGLPLQSGYRYWVASDASEDHTDQILQAIPDPRLIFVRMPERVGKNAALNRLARIATGDLPFFPDANSHVAAGCLRLMVPYFADTRVGGVTGVEESPVGPADRAIASGGRAFLDYERFAKSLESELGSVLVCDGAICCIRRSLYSEVEPALANDLELPLHIGHAGYWVLCEARAALWKGRQTRLKRNFHGVTASPLRGYWGCEGYGNVCGDCEELSRKLL